MNTKDEATVHRSSLQNYHPKRNTRCRPTNLQKNNVRAQRRRLSLVDDLQTDEVGLLSMKTLTLKMAVQQAGVSYLFSTQNVTWMTPDCFRLSGIWNRFSSSVTGTCHQFTGGVCVSMPYYDTQWPLPVLAVPVVIQVYSEPTNTANFAYAFFCNVRMFLSWKKTMR